MAFTSISNLNRSWICPISHCKYLCAPTRSDSSKYSLYPQKYAVWKHCTPLQFNSIISTLFPQLQQVFSKTFQLACDVVGCSWDKQSIGRITFSVAPPLRFVPPTVSCNCDVEKVRTEEKKDEAKNKICKHSDSTQTLKTAVIVLLGICLPV